jgi:hypothetical protein
VSGSDDQKNNGIAYFLPTGYIHFVAELQPTNNGNAAKPAAATSSNATPAGVSITVNQNNYAAGDTTKPAPAPEKPPTPPDTAKAKPA